MYTIVALCACRGYQRFELDDDMCVRIVLQPYYHEFTM